MKIKTLAGLLLLVIAFLIGTYAAEPAKAQVRGGVHPALKYMSVVHLDDGTGNLVPTIRIEGANLQLVNGLHATNGYPTDADSTDPSLTVTNSVGNLIVGYGS